MPGCSDDPAGPPTDSPPLFTLGNGVVADRYTGEVWVRGNVAYTTTWGFRAASGNAINIWDVAGNVPTLVNTVIVPDASTLGDVQTSDDGQLLIVATERVPGSIMIYSLADPVNPQLITRYTTALTNPGVHTAEVQRVNGRLYAFLSIDPAPSTPARLVIVDITDPAAPTQAFTAIMGAPYVHDVFVRDGILFTALWNQGIAIWDIGGVGTGSVSNPVMLGSLATVDGSAHNVWWYHNPNTGEKRYAFVGEEGAGCFRLPGERRHPRGGCQRLRSATRGCLLSPRRRRDPQFLRRRGARDPLRGILQRGSESNRHHRRPVELRRRSQGPEVRPLRPPPDGSRARPWAHS